MTSRRIIKAAAAADTPVGTLDTGPDDLVFGVGETVMLWLDETNTWRGRVMPSMHGWTFAGFAGWLWPPLPGETW